MRHDFEESFILLEGEIEATFRGAKSVVKEGEAVHIPCQRASPVSKHEQPAEPANCASPAGQEKFFAELVSQSRPERLPLRSWTRQLKPS